MDRRGDVVRVREHADTSHHHPIYVYESRVPCPIYASFDGNPADIRCQVVSNIRESGIWCDECGEAETPDPCLLMRSFTAAPFTPATVWHDTDTPNMTTGRVESDPKKFARHLAEQSEIMAERLGMPVDYQPCDPADTYVSDEGLDATHDRAVSEGRKDSRGRFVWTV